MLIKKVKENYSFTSWDENLLRKLAPVMEKHGDEFVDAFYNKAMQFKNASKYLKNDEIINKHKGALKGWFLKLFNGPYNADYTYYLERIGHAHVKVNLPSHYVNVSISFVRKFCSDIIMKEISACEERGDMLLSVGKILDINLDILTASYIEEEKNLFFISKKAENKLINFAKRFSYGLNLVLVIGLVFLGVTVLGLFAYDITHLFDGNIEKGLLATLGSLMILWVVIELVDTEIDHLKGAKFSIKVFVSVAMVAIIRKILVTSLKTEEVGAQISLIAALAVLGVVYWIVSHTEKREQER
ncbi:MAG: protoglobin domain-containing protein [Deltaproteobacteria bacterium]|nr:protoglobin domain-containing protein [Deltaproteobacteria bacterium]